MKQEDQDDAIKSLQFQNLSWWAKRWIYCDSFDYFKAFVNNWGKFKYNISDLNLSLNLGVFIE